MIKITIDLLKLAVLLLKVPLLANITPTIHGQPRMAGN